jgi:hypothetical protein
MGYGVLVLSTAYQSVTDLGVHSAGHTTSDGVNRILVFLQCGYHRAS